MRLEQLVLDSYRNYNNLSLSFFSNLIILVGDNAQGKTNLLESIYYLATGTAARTNNHQELINWQADYFKIKASINAKNGTRRTQIDLNYLNGKKLIYINGVKKNSVQELLGNLNVVLFTPEDLKLVKNSPSERRLFLNKEISQISSQYYYYLSQYKKILAQRNTAIKQWKWQKNTDCSELLNIWDNQIVYYGSRIVRARIQFIANLAEYAKNKHYFLSENNEELDIVYSTNCCEPNKCDLNLERIAAEYYQALTSSKKEELDKGVTIIGPQRDDLIFLINNREVKSFGSQGQQRSAVLSVKLALLDLIKDKTGNFPVLLLDDVMSELDHNRRNYLLKQTGNGIQAFITTTNLHPFSNQILATASILKVEKGNITPVELM